MDIPLELQGLTMPELLVALSQYFKGDIPDDLGPKELGQAKARYNEARKLLGDPGLSIYIPPPELEAAFENAFQNPVNFKRTGKPNWTKTALRYDLHAPDLVKYSRFRLNTEPGIRP